MILQKSLFQHFGKNYLAVMSAIETAWTDERINLSDIILRIICHVEINKRNEEDIVKNVKVLVTENPQASKERVLPRSASTEISQLISLINAWLNIRNSVLNTLSTI